MRNLTDATRSDLTLGPRLPLPPAMRTDPWVASSLLQKAIRRGDGEMAARAALTFHRLRGAGIWRRFCLIAFEDVGAASANTLAFTVVAATDADWRRQAGGDEQVICHLARRLAAAPKDRSSDHAICIAHDHPGSEKAREMIGVSSLARRLDFVANASLPLITRCVAAWYSSGIEWGDELRIGKGDLPALAETFAALGVPSDLVQATIIASRKTREPICLTVPLIWLQASEVDARSTSICSLPSSPLIGEIPAYAFDKHTVLGKAAIHRFASENQKVREVLEASVPDYRALEATCLAAFYADAALVAKRLDWMGSTELEKMGIEHDLTSCGVSLSGVEPLLQAVRENLDHLNEIRSLLHRTRTQRRSSNVV